MNFTISDSRKVKFVQVERNGSSDLGPDFGSFASPRVDTKAFAIARRGDVLDFDTAREPHRFNLDLGTFAIRFWVTSNAIFRSGTMFSLDDGTSQNALASNWKGFQDDGSFDPQAGTTIRIEGVPDTGIDPPMNSKNHGHELKPGWNSYALSIDRAAGKMKVCLNGGAITELTDVAFYGAGIMRYIRLGSFQHETGKRGQFLNGFIGGMLHMKDKYCSGEELRLLSTGLGC